jgi:hypothetical protein
MRFARGVFLVAGVYGLLVLTPQLFFEERVGQDYPPAVTHPEYFYGFLLVALSWQVAFLVMARNPARFRPLIPAAILEKIGFGVASVLLFMQGRLALLVLAFGLVDLLFAALFVLAYVQTRVETSVQQF